MNTNKRFWCLDEYKGETSPIVDGKFAPTNEWLCNKLNELHDENEQLKQFKDNVFDLIDKNIKETKELFEDGKIDLISYNGAMIILIGLKEELKGDDDD